MVVTGIPQTIGLVYVFIAVPVIAYLWYKGSMTRRVAFFFLIITVCFGFLIFSPMAPYQLQMAIVGGGPGPGTPLSMVMGLVIIFMVFAVLTGRIFCAQLCPIGAVQEIIYTDPKQKTTPSQKKIMMAIRFVFFIAFLAAGLLFSVSLLRFFGIKEFFTLEFNSAFFSVFVILIAISLFLYRPFCRLFCPLGTLLSLAAAKSLFKIRRTAACITCGKCEQVCPSAEAGADDQKMECYLCGRCIRICPAEGALVYSRETGAAGQEDQP